MATGGAPSFRVQFHLRNITNHTEMIGWFWVLLRRAAWWWVATLTVYYFILRSGIQAPPFAAVLNMVVLADNVVEWFTMEDIETAKANARKA